MLIVTVLGLRDATQRLTRVGRRREVMLLEAVEVALYGYLVTTMFVNDNIYQRYFWLLVGLAAGGRQVASRMASSQRPAPALDSPGRSSISNAAHTS